MEPLLLFLNRPDLTSELLSEVFEIPRRDIGVKVIDRLLAARRQGVFRSRKELTSRVKGLGPQRLAAMDQAVELGRLDSMIQPESLLSAFFQQPMLTPEFIDQAFEQTGRDIGDVTGAALLQAAAEGQLATRDDFLQVPGVGPKKLSIMLNLAASGLLFQAAPGPGKEALLFLNGVPEIIAELALPKFEIRYQPYEYDPDKEEAEQRKAGEDCVKELKKALTEAALKQLATSLPKDLVKKLSELKQFWNKLRKQLKDCSAEESKLRKRIKGRSNQTKKRIKKKQDELDGVRQQIKELIRQQKEQLADIGSRPPTTKEQKELKGREKDIAKLRKREASLDSNLNKLKEAEIDLIILALEKKCIYELIGLVKEILDLFKRYVQASQGVLPAPGNELEEQIKGALRGKEKEDLLEEIKRIILQAFGNLARLLKQCKKLAKLRKSGSLKKKVELVEDKLQNDLIRAAGRTRIRFNYCYYWRDITEVINGRRGKERCALRFIRIQPVAEITVNPNVRLYIRAKKTGKKIDQKRLSGKKFDALSPKEQQDYCLAEPYSVEAHERGHVCDFFAKLKKNWAKLVVVERLHVKSVLPIKTIATSPAGITVGEQFHKNRLDASLGGFLAAYLREDNNIYPHGASETAAIDYQRSLLQLDKKGQINVPLVNFKIGNGYLTYIRQLFLYERARNSQIEAFIAENNGRTVMNGVQIPDNTPACPRAIRPENTRQCLGRDAGVAADDALIPRFRSTKNAISKRVIDCPFRLK